MSRPRIDRIRGREILDTRGNPTVEVDVTLEDGTGGLQQLAAADPLPFGQGRFGRRPTTD